MWELLSEVDDEEYNLILQGVVESNESMAFDLEGTFLLLPQRFRGSDFT